jgi:phosphoribosylaminoimidazole (AIR) synthetase
MKKTNKKTIKQVEREVQIKNDVLEAVNEAPEVVEEPVVEVKPTREIQAIEVMTGAGIIIKRFTSEDGDNFVQEAKAFAVANNYKIGIK